MHPDFAKKCRDSEASYQLLDTDMYIHVDIPLIWLEIYTETAKTDNRANNFASTNYSRNTH